MRVRRVSCATMIGLAEVRKIFFWWHAKGLDPFHILMRTESTKLGATHCTDLRISESGAGMITADKYRTTRGRSSRHPQVWSAPRKPSKRMAHLDLQATRHHGPMRHRWRTVEHSYPCPHLSLEDWSWARLGLRSDQRGITVEVHIDGARHPS